MKVKKFEKGFVKHWTEGVPIEDEVWNQMEDINKLPFVVGTAIMPDAHVGIGCSIGSVVVTKGAIVPSIVGVDIGCGMAALNTHLNYHMIKLDFEKVKENIEKVIPHGFTRKRKVRDKGTWGNVPDFIQKIWNEELKDDFDYLCGKYKKIRQHITNVNQLGTLGTGNHFIELSKDEDNNMWIVIHSGSRGIGNKMARVFQDIAKKECRKWMSDIPNPDLAFLPEGSEYFYDYIKVVKWAQKYAKLNRQIMMQRVMDVFFDMFEVQPVKMKMDNMIDCHHNFTDRENHNKQNVLVTRKGAIRARKGDLGIIPGSMGACSYIVEGLGNEDSFNSSSHGAGRLMSRTKARNMITVEEHIEATNGVICKKDESILDESPAAYKNIDDVMDAQKDLVKIICKLKQFVCIKG